MGYTYQEKCRDEYGKVIEIIKHYSTIQFAQFSVFIVFMGVSMKVVFDSQYTFSPMIIVALFFVTLFMLIMEKSHLNVTHHFLKRACTLEKELNYKGYRDLPGAPYFKYSLAKIGIRLTYWMFLIIWLFYSSFRLML